MNNYRNQKTIAKEVCFTGLGLHSGEKANIKLIPSLTDTGIVFKRFGSKGSKVIPADFKFISNSKLCTTLESYDGKSRLYTVEHLLAAIKGNDIDNIVIEADKEEIPALDGSSLEFDKIIKQAGIVEIKGTEKRFLKVLKPIKVSKGASEIRIYPADHFSIDCTIDFPNPIGVQNAKLGCSLGEIYKKVMFSRTFCFHEDIETMKRQGLAKGGSLENAIVVKNGKILNKDGLRHPNEFVLHKVLDILGDFALANFNIIGQITAICPGHEINKIAMQKIFSDFSNYKISRKQREVDLFDANRLATAF